MRLIENVVVTLIVALEIGGAVTLVASLATIFTS
jgi:hypothetical protein